MFGCWSSLNWGRGNQTNLVWSFSLTLSINLSLFLSIFLLSLSLLISFLTLALNFPTSTADSIKKLKKTFYWRKRWMSFFLTNTRWHKMIPRKRKNRYSISTKRFLQIIYRSWKKSSLFTFSINCKFNCIQCIFAQLDSTVLWSSNGPLY